ncbi:glycosyltransferase family 9 protein [Stenotrophomonas sp. 22385]|uniref:glycosyltransferase family 9 protein n=1 Tax=Stenotrophomonas sp. 22385 TaxID=3453915 RepID=UPI003F83DCE5
MNRTPAVPGGLLGGRLDCSAFERPVVFFANALGDHLLTRPTILALAKSFKGRLGFMGPPYSAERFYPDAEFRCVCPVAFFDGANGAHDFEISAVLAYQREFDSVISLNPWHSPLLDTMKRAIAPKPFITLGSEFGILASRPPLRRDMASEIFSMASAFDEDICVDTFISVQPASPGGRSCANYILSKIPKKRKILCVHTWTHDAKRWPIESFRAVIKAFLALHPEFTVIVVDPVDTHLDVEMPAETVFSCDGVDLDTATDLVARSDLFLGIDSYFLHVADFSGIPNVGIFGPTDPRRWGAAYSPSVSLRGKPTTQVSRESVIQALTEMAERTDWTRRKREVHELSLWNFEN